MKNVVMPGEVLAMCVTVFVFSVCLFLAGIGSDRWVVATIVVFGLGSLAAWIWLARNQMINDVLKFIRIEYGPIPGSGSNRGGGS